MKYTKGPWEVLNNYVKKVGGGVIATTARNNAACRFEADVASWEDAANASLIAAAPELLEACKYVVAWHREHDSGEGELFGLDYVTTCISAIRKTEVQR